MRPVPQPRSPPLPRSTRSLLLGLLVVSIGINYIDRGNLSVAARDISLELRLSPQDQGLLFSAFFCSYSLCLLPAGWFVERYRASRVYAIGYLGWSAATAFTAATHGFASLFALRLALGAGESVAYPSYSKIITARFSESERGMANAWIDAGSKIGPALGVLAGGLLLEAWGWRGMFLAVGLASMLWLAPWALLTRNLPRADEGHGASESAAAPSFLRILRERAAWATFLGLFCGNYAWYFLLTWLPLYLLNERHYTVRMMAFYGSLPFWGVAAASLTGGWLSDRLIRRGAGPSPVRRRFAGYGLLMCTLLVPAFLVRDNLASMALLIAACLSFGLYSSNVWAITQTLAGKSAAAKWTGLQNAFGNLSGIAAPFLTGQIVGRTGSYFWAFATVAAIAVLGGVCFLRMVGTVRQVEWVKISDPTAASLW